MALRFETIAHAAFFRQRQTNGEYAWANLPVFDDLTHGVALNCRTKQFYCTCSFSPNPCVHAQALNCLYEREGSAVFDRVETLPQWVAILVQGAMKSQSQTTATPASQPKPASGQRRLERAANGFDDLELWLLDTVRRGLANGISEDPALFERIAARLADASMRSLSRTMRLLGPPADNHPAWADKALVALADAALALQAFRNRERLAEALLSDLEAFLGLAIKKEQILTEGEHLHDFWAVVGIEEEVVEGALRQRRTWLYGELSGRFALLSDFAFGDAEFLPGLCAGTVVDGELVFYPSGWPLRALAPSSLNVTPKTIDKLPGHADAEAMLSAYAHALGAQPWLLYFPAILSDVIPVCHNGQFGLADQAGKYLPLDAEKAWPILALSGGRPLDVFAEWNGSSLYLLSAIAGGRFAIL